MKNLILVLSLILVACNFHASDSLENLPSNYQFIQEGGSQNRILRDNLSIIDSGAVNFSFDNKFIFFSVDTTYSIEPSKISKENLVYYIHNIGKDTISKQVNYDFVKKFILKNEVEDENNILLKK